LRSRRPDRLAPRKGRKPSRRFFETLRFIEFAVVRLRTYKCERGTYGWRCPIRKNQRRESLRGQKAQESNSSRPKLNTWVARRETAF
jgi:hypothetical protein